MTAPAIALDDLPPVDVVLLSRSTTTIWTWRGCAAHAPLIAISLGNDAIVRAAVPGARRVDGHWWDRLPLRIGDFDRLTAGTEAFGCIRLVHWLIARRQGLDATARGRTAFRPKTAAVDPGHGGPPCGVAIPHPITICVRFTSEHEGRSAMRYSKVEYASTAHDDYLELHLYDGTYRGVMFKNAAAAGSALAPGRAEVGGVAIDRGFLPAGAKLVSRAGVSPNVVASEPKAVEFVERLASRSEFITPESDMAAKLAHPVESARYDGILADMFGSGTTAS